MEGLALKVVDQWGTYGLLAVMLVLYRKPIQRLLSGDHDTGDNDHLNDIAATLKRIEKTINEQIAYMRGKDSGR